ncbi:DUF1624 domain-containing protein [Candidatus Woesearchaeota archaeon]|nr:DUF1624 domain-containing protein [Candidatus Woesearchaeota archaeon]
MRGNKIKNRRFWEIDAFRGIAIILMIIYHLLFDLHYFLGLGFDVSTGIWRALQVAVAGLFLLLVGISLTLSRRKHFPEFFKRGIMIFSWGIAISIVTYIFIPDAWIFFGILHMIGISIMIGYLFLRYKWLDLIIGLAVITAGILLSNYSFDFPWLIWLGLKPEVYYTVDMFSLMPWFGVVLIGIFLGKIMYSKGERRFNFPEVKSTYGLSWIGRHSLMIYLIHQPILMGVIFLMGML